MKATVYCLFINWFPKLSKVEIFIIGVIIIKSPINNFIYETLTPKMLAHLFECFNTKKIAIYFNVVKVRINKI